MRINAFLASIVITLLFAAFARAGYEQPCYIDGCQSIDGRFVITATQTERGKSSHGPNKWSFTWKDTKTGQTETFEAKGVQGGQIYGQLFIAPDGQTFALWNHVTMYWSEKSHMHASAHVPKREEMEAAKWRTLEYFSNRIIVYRKDGSILKALGVNDLLKDEEWEGVLPVFNRVHWVQPYDGLNFKATPRTQYAFYRVSPDYTVLEFQAVSSRAKRKEAPRVVRVSLTDGRVLGDDEKLTDVSKIPVRPFQGDDHLPKSDATWKESYTPSLDPVRTAGTFAIASAAEAVDAEKAPKQAKFEAGQVRLIKGGFKKADTPAWLPAATGKKEPARLAFTDLELEKLYLFTPPDAIEEVRAGASRGKAGPDKKFYGVFDLKLASWRPGEEPSVIIEKAGGDREISLNDLTVSSRGLIYFTTLKDPDKGRLSVVDVENKTVSVLFDGDNEPTLANPNGVALSPDERFLYVGISSYDDRKHSGVYCFPIKADGTLDVEAGKAKPWADVKAPDGIAVDRQGSVYFTAGNTVHVYDRYARPWGKIKIPKGSGTNLCLGGERDEVLYITTFDALYAVELPKK